MSERRQQQSTSDRFLRGAGTVRDDDKQLWGPVKWVAQLVQYMVAIIMVTIGKGIEAIFKGEAPSKKKSREEKRTA